MPFTHVRVELVVAEEALAAELAQGMDAAFDLLRLLAVVASVASDHGRQVDGEDIGVVEGVLVGEDLLEAYAQIAGGADMFTPVSEPE